MTRVVLEVLRGTAPWQREVEVNRDTTVLDALQQLEEDVDPTLTFRAACRHGLCGDCAIEIEGRPALACVTRVLDVARRGQLRLGPLRGLPVLRDLVVDRTAFWEQHARAQPWLHPVADDGATTVTPEYVAALDEAEACIHCAACFSACPVAGPGFTFAGPHAAVQARVRAGDPRDRRHAESAGTDALGLDHCHGVYACVDACPQGLDPAAAVFALRRGPRGAP